jgi:hypothetical protein
LQLFVLQHPNVGDVVHVAEQEPMANVADPIDEYSLYIKKEI